MRHRHVNHSRLTLAAIDDIIARGQWRHWADLRRAIRRDPTILDRIERICVHLDDSDLSEYRDLAPKWRDWDKVKSACGRVAIETFDHVCDGT